MFRLPAWLATLLGSIVTFALAVWVWKMPLDHGAHAYLYGSATGIWNVDWITFWGLILFNTLSISGIFENFRRWLIAQGSMDVRVQTILFAWAFGALLEGLVGFGYPWAVVAPILISLGISDLNAIRVAAIANNAPVSYGALGAPIITLAAVTGIHLLALSGSVGAVVAVLALLPPWILLYLVSGKDGMKVRGRWRSSVRWATSPDNIRSRLSWPLPARCHRFDCMFHRASVPAQILAAQDRARLRWQTGGTSLVVSAKGTWTFAPQKCGRRGCPSRCCWSSSRRGPARGRHCRK